MKRVNCLYRVSTLGQVDVLKDDIPMQKIACHEFAEMRGWEITKEYSEKGVSGSKVHAEKRDAIQQLKQNALNKEFDILLVYMFDRIGRIDDETPFVVEWFVANGIEVWSVQEGEQRFDSHVDKLMNYIRFWQAAGESAKTSMRIKTRMKQLVAEGRFVTGKTPYGYDFVKCGTLNKKGQEVHDLVINEEEAKIVREIFALTVTQGIGTHTIAKMLNDRGVRTHSGAMFSSTIIKQILKNKKYIGYYVSGDVCSDKFDNIVIIEDDLFQRAQEIVDQRERKFEESRSVSRRTQGDNLLSGNIFCADCGSRLVFSTSKRKNAKQDGTFSEYCSRRYICSNRVRLNTVCKSATSYKAEKIEEAVVKVVKDLFARLSDTPETKAVDRKIKAQLSEAKATQKKQAAALEKLNKQYEKLQLEIANTLTGDSIYSADDLALAIRTVKAKILETEKKLDEATEAVDKINETMQSIVPMYKRFVSWSNTFDEMTAEEKRMVLTQLIQRIEVNRGYEINITLNMDYEQFCTDWNSDLTE